MVLGNHVIIGAYGFWLPNDPRGSWSEFVGSWELYRRYGPATKTMECRSVAHNAHDRELRLAAKNSLKYPAVEFTGLQARAIGRGFAKYAQKAGLEIWACSILPEHMHLVLARHRLLVEQLVIQLKGAATEQLLAEGLHPFGDLRDQQNRVPKAFARGEWKVHLDSRDDVQRSIEYAEENPLKEGKKKQTYSFITTCRLD